MAITDIRLSVLATINEVRIRRGLSVVSSLSQDSQSVMAVRLLNDVVSEISDYGDWNETLVSANVTCVSSVQDYSIVIQSSASAPAQIVKTIKDIYFGSAGAAMFMISQEEMRLFSRNVTGVGDPRQWTVWGTDSNGNPVVRVNPNISSTAAGEVLSMRVHVQPPLYTTSDDDVIIPFSSRMVVQGLLAACILDEEGGSPTDHYTREQNTFENMLKETYNRYKADAGRYRRFVPGSQRYRRSVR